MKHGNAAGEKPPAADRAGHTFWRTLKLVAPFKVWILLAVLLGFATIGSSIGLMATSAFIIAKAALRPSIAELQVAIVGVRFFGLARGGMRYLERLVSHHVTFLLLTRLRVWFYQALEPLAPARLMGYHSGDLLSRAVADVETLEQFFGRVVAPPAVALLVGLFMGLFLVGFDKWLALTALTFLALAGAGLPLFIQRLGRGTGRQMVAVRADLNAALVDGVQGLAELVAFGQEGRHQERVRRLNRELAVLQRRMAWIGGLHAALMGLIVSLATLGVVVVAAPLVRDGTLNGVQLAVVLLAVVASFEAVAPLPGSLQYLENSLEAARRLFELVDAEPAVRDPVMPSPVPEDYSLRVEGLTFCYAPGEPPALEDVSFAVPSGGSVAVVGPSGAGKSTLVNLLLRFWPYESGQILLAGYALQAYPQEDLRGMVAVVSQHTHLFNGTVRENLLMACPDAGEAALVRAAEAARLHEFLQGLPEGYDTWIGEGGVRLSAGQRQRLAIARAMLKDTPIVILDEPTTNLDAVTEWEVLRALQETMVGRTTLIITHRLAGLEGVDEIVVLDAGRVVERGQHAALVRRGGVYAEMWELQNQVFVA